MTTPEPTTASGWKKASAGTDLALPSGNVARCKKIGMEKLLKMGLMPDSLTPIAMQAIQKAESGGRPMDKRQQDQIEKELMDKVLSNPEDLENLMLTFDKVLCKVVIEPAVRMGMYTEDDEREGTIPQGWNVNDEIPDRYRSDETLYSDDVDLEDKQFIFQWVVGGTSDLEQFRRESGAALEAAQSR